MMGSTRSYLQLAIAFALVASPILSGCKDSGQADVNLAKGDGNGKESVQEKYTSEQKTYITDVTNLPAYTAVLAPIFAKLNGDAKTPWETLISLKKWLFIPQKLDATHSANLSAHLIGDEADTIATQRIDDIWVQKTLFKELSQTDQSRVLLQEAVTSLYLLKNLTDQELCALIKDAGKKTDKCKFSDADDEKSEDGQKEDLADETSQQEEIETIAKKEDPKKPIHDRKRLNEIDYHKIGVITLYIQETSPLTQKKLLKKMEDVGFDMRIFQATIKN